MTTKEKKLAAEHIRDSIVTIVETMRKHVLTYEELATLRECPDFGQLEVLMVMHRIINAFGDEDNSAEFSGMIADTMNSCEEDNDDDEMG